MEKGSEVEKQVDRTKVSTSFHMSLFNATYAMIGENIKWDLIPILEHVQSANILQNCPILQKDIDLVQKIYS